MSNSPVPRRFALLGKSVESPGLEAAIRQSSTHRFVVTCGSELPDVPVAESVDSLLDDKEWDATLCSPDEEEAVAAALRLSQRQRPVVVEVNRPPPAEFVAEAALLEAEGGGRIVPFFRWRALPALRLLQRMVVAGDLGPLLEVSIDRFCHDGATLNEAATGMGLLTDIDVARMLGGDYSQVTVLQTEAAGAGMLQQTVRLTGSDLPAATCTCRLGDESQSVCRVVGTQGAATIKTGSDCRLEVDGNAPIPTAAEDADVDTLSLRILDESLRADPHSLRWQDLERFYQIKAAMDRSIKRRRTIDLHFETASERGQFKTQMATVGCGVILWTMFGIVGLLFAGAVLDPRDRMQIESEAAGFVLTGADFQAGTDRLTDAADSRLSEIAGRLESSETVVFVAASDAEATAELDRRRLKHVRRKLAEQGVEEVDRRTVLRPLKGSWFTGAMQLARVLVFAPVAVYLLLQLLLAVAKPPAPSTDSLDPSSGRA